jgi:RHS repeat-associated protein
LDKDAWLYDFGARPYDPKTARFLSADSIGFDSGDANFYRFEGNDPIDNLDPTEHSLIKPTQAIGTLGAAGIGSGFLGLGLNTALNGISTAANALSTVSYTALGGLGRRSEYSRAGHVEVQQPGSGHVPGFDFIGFPLFA